MLALYVLAIIGAWQVACWAYRIGCALWPEIDWGLVFCFCIYVVLLVVLFLGLWKGFELTKAVHKYAVEQPQ